MYLSSYLFIFQTFLVDKVKKNQLQFSPSISLPVTDRQTDRQTGSKFRAPARALNTLEASRISTFGVKTCAFCRDSVSEFTGCVVIFLSRFALQIVWTLDKKCRKRDRLAASKPALSFNLAVGRGRKRRRFFSLKKYTLTLQRQLRNPHSVSFADKMN